MADTDIVSKEKIYTGLDLEKLIDGIDDVTDPSSMDKLLGYVEELRDEDETFIELLALRCKDAEIYWKRPWYQECLRLSYTPRPTVTSEESFYRTDPISQEEHEKIVKNWCKFRKRYDLPDQIISLARWKNYKSKNVRKSPEERARQFAVAFLARGLRRTSYQVFFHITTHFGGYRTGFYSALEEKIIEICFFHKPKMMGVILSMLLGRRPRGVYKRLTQLTNGKPERKRLKWTLPLASKFVNHLLEHTQLPLEDLKYKQFEMWVWRKLEEDMDQNYNYLHHFWYCYLHVQLFVKCDVKLHKLKKKLLKKILAKARDSTYRVWSDIRWKDILLDFPDGFTHRFLYVICYIFISRVKGYIRMPLEKLAEHALQLLKKQRLKKRNKRLRTLRLRSDGQLEVVDYRQNETND